MSLQSIHKQQGIILLTSLIIMIMLSAGVVVLWQQVYEQGFLVRRDKQAAQEKEAIKQLNQQVSKHFLQNHKHCYSAQHACIVTINHIKLSYYQQILTTYNCYVLNNHTVTLWRIKVSPVKHPSRYARLLYWGQSNHIFQPKKCSDSSIKTLSTSQISWLLQA